MTPRFDSNALTAYVKGTFLLCGVFLCVGIAGAAVGASLGFSARRLSMVAISGAALLFAVQPPGWLNRWRRALGEARARWVLLLTAVLALVLALFGSLAGLTTLIPR